MSKSNVILTIPEPKKFELVEKPYPKIKAGYAIVSNDYAGVCLEGSRIWAKHHFEKFYGGGQSDYPDGLGHESVGVVEEVIPAPTSARRPGDHLPGRLLRSLPRLHECPLAHLLCGEHLSAEGRHDPCRYGRPPGLERERVRRLGHGSLPHRPGGHM